MTCIVALVDNDTSWIAGERAASTDDWVGSLATPKIWRVGEYMMGYFGSLAGAKLQHNFVPPAMGDANPDQFMQTSFLDSLHEYYEENHIEKSRLGFIIIVKNLIYTHDAEDMSISRYNGNFVAEGSGAQYAFGALASTQNWGAFDRIRNAVNVAIQYSPSCAGNVDVIRSDKCT